MASCPRLDRYRREHPWSHTLWRIGSSELQTRLNNIKISLKRLSKPNQFWQNLPFSSYSIINLNSPTNYNDSTGAVQLSQIVDRLYSLRIGPRLRDLVFDTPPNAFK
jgi:hypothetical protein